MPYPLAVMDSKYRIERINEAMARKLGVSVKEAIGLSCYEHLHWTDRPLPSCPLSQLMLDGKEHALEIAENRFGRDHLVSLSSLANGEGKVIGCLYVARELAEQERVPEVDTPVREKMERVVRDAHYTISIQDLEGRYIYFSALPAGGLSPWDVPGKMPEDLFDPDMAKKMVEKVRQVVQSRKDLNQASEIVLDGGTLRFLDKISPIKDAAGQIEAVVTISKKLGEDRPPGERSRSRLDKAQSLSTREREILQLIASGFTNRQIADQLAISIKTVETHRSRIMQKLDLHKASALVRYAVKAGLF